MLNHLPGVNSLTVLSHLSGVNNLSGVNHLSGVNRLPGVNVSVLNHLPGVKFAGRESLIDRSVGMVICRC